MMKKIRCLFVTGASLVVVAELAARTLGFHEAPLYECHEDFEYRTLPNQKVWIWCNRYETNALGMRGELPDTASALVWVCGDSVINGGVYCDEDSLAVEKIDKRLEPALGKPVSAINISQGSWGPGNTWNFVQHYKSQLGRPNVIIHVLNSQDWRDEMTHCYQGDSNDMPSTPSFLALVRVAKELLGDDRSCEALANRQGDTSQDLMAWISFARENEVPLAVHLHPSAMELDSQTWSKDGLLLTDFLTSQGVLVSSGLGSMTVADYRDKIHINESGQGHLADVLTPLIQSMLTLR